LVTAIPYAFGSVAMVLWGRHSDRTRERVWHLALPLLLTAVALAVSGYLANPLQTMIALTLAAIGIFCTFALFWTLPTAFLSGTAAAGAIALINALGNLAGFGGPYLIGWVKEHSGSTAPGMLVLAALPLIAAGLVLTLKHDRVAEFGDRPARKTRLPAD
jgi:nitrate/nitrite transporter NarK